MTPHFSKHLLTGLLACAAIGLASCSPNAGQPEAEPVSHSLTGIAPASDSNETVELVDFKKIQPAPTQPDQLSDEQRTRIKSLQKTFSEVDGQSVEQWNNSFRRDENPEREIKVWERLAKAYVKYCSRRRLPIETRKEIYKVLLLRSMSPPGYVLKELELKRLSESDAIEVMQGF